MSKRLFVACCIIIAIGGYGYHKFFSSKNNKHGQMPLTVVRAAVVSQGDWQKMVLANGELTAGEGITLSPEILGRVTGIYFASGQYVKKGTPLVQLYPDIIKADLAKAVAKLDVDEDVYKRHAALYQKGFYSRLQLDTEKSTIVQDKADVDSFKSKLDQLLIKAPFDGVLGIWSANFSLGSYLNAGDPITSLQSIDPVFVDFSVPDIYINQIKTGDRVVVTSAALGETYQGKIFALDSRVNKETRTLKVRVSLPNNGLKLVPGTNAQVTVYLGQPAKFIIVSQDAIAFDLSGSYVYKVINNHAVKTPVALGNTVDANNIIVLQGLKEGDVIITAGQVKLSDGAPVVVNPTQLPLENSAVNSEEAAQK